MGKAAGEAREEAPGTAPAEAPEATPDGTREQTGTKAARKAGKLDRKARKSARTAQGKKGRKKEQRTERKTERRAGRDARRRAKAQARVARPPFRVRARSVAAQWRALVRCSHPRHAVLLALAVGVLAHLSDRPLREALSAGGAMLLVQLMLGLANDVTDIEFDRRSGATGKPLAEGRIPRGNVTYAIAVLLIFAVPLSFQNGATAAVVMGLVLLVGAAHNKWLHHTAFSWLGWVVTFALLPAFLAYGSWPGEPAGPAPTIAFTAASAGLGLCLHFATTLRDLVGDHKGGSRNLPLRIALRIGAPKLLLLTVLASVAAIAGLVAAGLTVGLRQ